jgi:oligoendopeptidase F
MSATADHLQDPELLAAEWDLQPLVDGDSDAGVARQLEEAGARAGAFAERYAGTVGTLDAEGMREAMEELAAINELVGKASSYASLQFATDTADPARGALLAMMQERATEVETQLLFFELEWAAIPDEQAEAVLSDPDERYDFFRHHLRSVRRYRPHLLSEPEEKILAEKAIASQAQWARLFGELISAVKVPLDGSDVSLEIALAKLQDPDRAVRQSSAEAVSVALEPGLRTRAFIFNTLAADKAVEDRLRSYPHWLASRNLSNEASDESVMALIEAVRGRFDIPQRWYRLKAKLLGIDKIADFDLARRRQDRPPLLRRALGRRAGARGQARRRLLRLHRSERAPVRDAELHGTPARRADDGARARPRTARGARGAAGRLSHVDAADARRDGLGVRRDPRVRAPAGAGELR